VSWRTVYALMAALMAVGVIATFAAEEPPARAPPHTLRQALTLPFLDFVRRLGGRGTAAVLAFAALYKFGDQFSQSMMPTFILDGVHFSKTEFGTISKAMGFVGTVVGAGIGGAMVTRFGVWRMLIVFGVVQAATLLLYAWLAIAGHDAVIFAIATFVDNVANAMGTGAFLAYLMSLTSSSVSATQFALLTSLSSVGQRVFGPLASHVVTAVGWAGFFVVATIAALPGLVLAVVLSRADTRRRLAGSPPATSP
jgi:PAT family beta-lactamase induction signal transducer AmpG